MALVTCPECRQPMSGHANACPKCGYSLTRRMRWEVAAGVLLAVTGGAMIYEGRAEKLGLAFLIAAAAIVLVAQFIYSILDGMRAGKK